MASQAFGVKSSTVYGGWWLWCEVRWKLRKFVLVWAKSGLYFKCFAFKNLKTGAGLSGLKVLRFSGKNLRFFIEIWILVH